LPEPDEIIIFEGRAPWKAFHFQHGILWLLLIGWNFGILISYGEKLSRSLKLTSKRVVEISGLISQHEEQVDLYRVTDTGFKQGFIERIFRVGTISIISEDTTSPEFSFRIHNPKDHLEKIRKYVPIERKKMGKFIA
jgi:uncharacterized membrane protein YdbT with pleckstrin-like domain